MRKNGSIVKCQLCGKDMYIIPSLLKKNRGKYCSKSCSSKVSIFKVLEVRDYDVWIKNTRKALKKRANTWQNDETKHPNWKGDKVGYFGVHDWITKHYGQPKKCEVCGLDDEKRKYHWANISGLYKRNITDWKRMCVSCHRKYDYGIKRKNKKLENISINEGNFGI